jgi:hypothetical protein
MSLLATALLKPKVIDTYPVNFERWDEVVDEIQVFDSASGWSVLENGSGLDTETTFEGKPTMKLVSPGGVVIRPRYNFNRTVDLTPYDYVELVLKLDRRIEEPDDVSLRFSKDDWSIENPMPSQHPYYMLPSNQWVRVRLNVHAVTPNVPWDEIRRFRIFYLPPDGAPITMHIAKMHGVRVKRALVSIGFDDSYNSVYNTAFPIMSQYGLAGAFYIITSQIGGTSAVTWNQLREMRDRGWVIGSHTHTHVDLGDSNVSDEEKIQDIMRADAILKQQGFRDGARFFACPYGQRPPAGGAVDTLLRSLTINRRLVGGGTVANQTSPVGVFYGDRLRGVVMGADQTVQYAIDLIDEAVEKKLYLEFLFHIIVQNPTQSTQFAPDDFEEVCAYIADLRDAGQLDVVTPADLYLQHSGEVVTVEGVDYVRSADATGRTLMLKLPG